MLSLITHLNQWAICAAFECPPKRLSTSKYCCWNRLVVALQHQQSEMLICRHFILCLHLIVSSSLQVLKESMLEVMGALQGDKRNAFPSVQIL